MEHDPTARDRQEERLGRQSSAASGSRNQNHVATKRTKFRKAHMGRIRGNAKGGTATFGSYGLKATRERNCAPD